MKTIEKLLLKACGYTVLILGLFYLFGVLSAPGAALINAKTFLIILLFGFLISCAGLVLECKKIHMALRVLIHYIVLLISFYCVFITSGNIKADSAAKIFIAAAIFTLFYGIMFGFVYILRFVIKKSDQALEKKNAKNVSKKAKTSSYKPLYKSDDE